MNDKFNLDEHLDYEKRFFDAIRKPKISGGQLTGCCPFHDDRHASFSANLATGQWKCHACGKEGNYLSFYALQHGVSTADAYKALLREEGLYVEPKPKAKKTADGDKLAAEYAAAKHLDLAWLKQTTGMGFAGVDKVGVWLKIPYMGEDGKMVTYRKRYVSGTDQRFSWPKGAKMLPYGLWRLKETEKTDFIVLVEGESDAQTLWMLGCPALGIPGASMFKAEWVTYLKDKKRIFVHVEPDNGGQTFLRSVVTKLHEGGYQGTVKLWSCDEYGVKDPSELLIRDGAQEAKSKLQKALSEAKSVSWAEFAEKLPAAIEDAPLHLMPPDGWQYDDHGIHAVNPQTGELVCICRTPIILTRRLRSTASQTEKIEIAYKRDAKWRTVICERTTAFSARSILELANFGITVTSENAKHVVRFLEQLEAANMERIPVVKSTTRLGWQGTDAFLPGHAPEVVVDVPDSMQHLISAFRTSGSLDGWIAMTAPHRARPVFRFLLAASFAAPLLRIVKQHSFVAYCWADSRSGKTAALKAALSVWGCPDELMSNFNATQVAIENIAGLFCDLPVGIDERQMGGKQDALEKIVYMIANGAGRGRGAKDGGMRVTKTWRTVAIATGEEPISGNSTMTGVDSRTIEIVGAPFDDEAEASRMHQTAAENYGWAGEAYTECIMQLGDEQIAAWYSEIADAVSALGRGANGSHLASVSVVALADYLASRLIFAEPEAAARENALQMAQSILDGMRQNARGDVNENALHFIEEWIASNRAHFSMDGVPPCYGNFAGDGENMYIVPSCLYDALTKAGYNHRKTLQYLASTGRIKTDSAGKTTVTKRVNGNVIRVVVFRLATDTVDEDTSHKADFIEVADDTVVPFGA